MLRSARKHMLGHHAALSLEIRCDRGGVVRHVAYAQIDRMNREAERLIALHIADRLHERARYLHTR